MVRGIFRILSSLVEKAEEKGPLEENLTAGESDMASGLLRSDESHTSDISLSSLGGSKAGKAKRVNGSGSRMSRSKRSEKKKTVSIKSV